MNKIIHVHDLFKIHDVKIYADMHSLNIMGGHEIAFNFNPTWSNHDMKYKRFSEYENLTNGTYVSVYLNAIFLDPDDEMIRLK